MKELKSMVWQRNIQVGKTTQRLVARNTSDDYVRPKTTASLYRGSVCPSTDSNISRICPRTSQYGVVCGMGLDIPLVKASFLAFVPSPTFRDE